MQNIVKRIEALEKAVNAFQLERDNIMEKALPSPAGDWEALVSAGIAEYLARPLSEREMAAKQLYTDRIEQQCHAFGWPGTIHFRWDLNLVAFLWSRAKVHRLAHLFLIPEIDSLKEATQAREDGIPLTEEQRVVFERAESILKSFSETVRRGVQ